MHQQLEMKWGTVAPSQREQLPSQVLEQVLLFYIIILNVLVCTCCTACLPHSAKLLLWHYSHGQHSLWMWPTFWDFLPVFIYLFIFHILVKSGDIKPSFAETVCYRLRIHWNSTLLPQDHESVQNFSSYCLSNAAIVLCASAFLYFAFTPVDDA
jgi:hypothetical protein